MALNTKTFRWIQALLVGAALIAMAGSGPEAIENPLAAYLPGSIEKRADAAGFRCGKTFITLPMVGGQTMTIRKAAISQVLGSSIHEPEVFYVRVQVRDIPVPGDHRQMSELMPLSRRL